MVMQYWAVQAKVSILVPRLGKLNAAWIVPMPV